MWKYIIDMEYGFLISMVLFRFGNDSRNMNDTGASKQQNFYNNENN